MNVQTVFVIAGLLLIAIGHWIIGLIVLVLAVCD